MVKLSAGLAGTILDATALIDFQFLGAWDWLNIHYAPLYIAQEVLSSDRLTVDTRAAAAKHLCPVVLDSEDMLRCFMELGLEVPLLSSADRATLVLAQDRFLLCASDDGLVVRTCERLDIPYIRLLRLLKEMVRTDYRTVAQVKELAQQLIDDRGKYISPSVLQDWVQSLDRLK